MPPDTDERIRLLCARLCTLEDDSEVSVMIGKLRAAIAEHLRRAKGSMGMQASMIRKMDHEEDNTEPL